MSPHLGSLASSTFPQPRQRPIVGAAADSTGKIVGSGSGSTDFLGDYKSIAVQGADVHVVWQDTLNDAGDIYFSRAAGAAAGPR